jgi:hypothetical protein
VEAPITDHRIGGQCLIACPSCCLKQDIAN